MNFLKFILILFVFGCANTTEVYSHAADSGPSFVVHEDAVGGKFIRTPDGNSVTANKYGCPAYWDKDVFPLEVVVDETLSFKKVNSIITSVQKWNLAVPEGDIFSIRYLSMEEAVAIDEPSYGQIYVLFDKDIINAYNEKIEEEDRNIIGVARMRYKDGDSGKNGEYYSGYISLSPEVSGEYLVALAVHELGHTVGLHHDDDILSVMNEIILLPNTVIDDRDALRVRKMREGEIESLCF